MLRACCITFSRVLRVQCTSCCCSALPEQTQPRSYAVLCVSRPRKLQQGVVCKEMASALRRSGCCFGTVDTLCQVLL